MTRRRSTRGGPALALALSLWLPLWLPLAACAIQRSSTGSPLRADPAQIVAGESDRAGVLELFGAPDQILRSARGDVFVYRFVRRNSDTFTLEEPVFTNLLIFSYSRVREKEDRLVVVFDADGRVESYGVLRGTRDLGGEGG